MVRWFCKATMRAHCDRAGPASGVRHCRAVRPGGTARSREVGERRSRAGALEELSEAADRTTDRDCPA